MANDEELLINEEIVNKIEYMDIDDNFKECLLILLMFEYSVSNQDKPHFYKDYIKIINDCLE